MALIDTPASTELKPYMQTDRIEILRVLITGIMAGILVPLLGNIIANGFISPVFCNADQDLGICASGGIVAYHVSAIVIAMIVVALFANWGVFRPLPLVLAATIAMWGFKKFVDPLAAQNVFEYFLFSALISAVAYVLFYWLLRLRNFPVSIILTVSATALICWALVA